MHRVAGLAAVQSAARALMCTQQDEGRTCRLRLRVMVGGLGFALAACSPTSYEKQVGGLAEGLSAAKAAFANLSEEERKAYITSQIRRGLRAGNTIEIPENCGPATNPKVAIDCTPYVYDAATKAAAPIVFKPAAPQGLKLSSLLDDYGKGLVQLTAAKDLADLKEAAGAATGAVSTLAGTVGGPPVGVGATAIFGIFNWFLGWYLDVRRVGELRHVVEAADPSIEIAARLLSDEAVLLQTSVVSKRSVDLALQTRALARLRQSNIDRAKIEAAAEGLIVDGLALDRYAKADVKEPFVKMRAAHAELLKALQNPRLQPDQVFAAIKDFVEQVKKLQTAFAKSGN